MLNNYTLSVAAKFQEKCRKNVIRNENSIISVRAMIRNYLFLQYKHAIIVIYQMSGLVHEHADKKACQHQFSNMPGSLENEMHHPCSRHKGRHNPGRLTSAATS